jgi:hypothetical protein
MNSDAYKGCQVHSNCKLSKALTQLSASYLPASCAAAIVQIAGPLGVTLTVLNVDST